MKHLRWLVLLILTPSALLARPKGEPTYHLHPPVSPIPATLFGLHIHHLIEGAKEPTPWPSIPFGTWRLLDAYVDWPHIETKPGKWDFTLLDRYIKMAEEHNVELDLPLYFSPPWASARPDGAFQGRTAEPKDMKDWENYVRAVATHCKGHIHIYEIWNEPNYKGDYTGSVENMVALTRAAYKIIKEVDPSNIVVSPSAMGVVNGVQWLSDFLRQGGGRYVDVIGYHFYVTPSGPEAMIPLIEQVKQAMARYGAGDKPLWDTETGWFIHSDERDVKSSGPAWPVLSAGQAVGYVARAFVLCWASGVRRLNWYDWDSDTMGLAEPGGKRKPAAYAYYMTEKWLIGSRMTSCDSDSSGTWICHLTRGGGYNGYLVWNVGGSRTFAVPKAWNAQDEQELSGKTQAVKDAKSVGIGINPVLLENKRP